MELMQALKDRRAVRDYADTPLSKRVIEGLIAAATLAPSAMNQQPWAFAVVTDRARIDSWAQRAARWMLDNPGSHGLGKQIPELLATPDFSMFYHAPALILVMARTPSPQAAEDCCLAAENLMLAARDEGIGTCCIGLARGWLNLPAIRMELGLPENYCIVIPIVAGFPVSWPAAHDRYPAEIRWI